jgi:hypothetical protein
MKKPKIYQQLATCRFNTISSYAIVPVASRKNWSERISRWISRKRRCRRLPGLAAFNAHCGATERGANVRGSAGADVHSNGQGHTRDLEYAS